MSSVVIPDSAREARPVSSVFVGRALLGCAAVALALLPYALSQCAAPDHYDRVWRAYGVRTMTPIFADLRGVTAALRCYEDSGLEIYEANPCDPWQRRYNYPRIWLQLSHVGVEEAHTEILGFAMAALFIAAVSHFAGVAGWAGILLMAPLLLSPPVALLVERGNNDLVVFLLLYATALAAALAGPSRFVAHGLLLLAAVLKLYPCFAFVALLKERTLKCIAASAAVCVLFGGYVLAFFGDLERIDRSTGSPVGSAYGVGILIAYYRGYIGVLIPQEYHSWVRWALLALSAGAGFALGFWRRRWLWSAQAPAPSAAVTGFQVGAAVFIGTYFLDNHYYYRLVHLLLCVPFLARLIAAGSPLLRWLGLGAWLGMVLAFWGELFAPWRVPAIEEWAGLGLCGVLALLLGATLPAEPRPDAAAQTAPA